MVFAPACLMSPVQIVFSRPRRIYGPDADSARRRRDLGFGLHGLPEWPPGPRARQPERLHGRDPGTPRYQRLGEDDAPEDGQCPRGTDIRRGRGAWEIGGELGPD